MEIESELAASLGRRIRRARWSARRSQRAVAAAAGVSQTMISRIELGKGSSVSLGTWELIAAAVGLDLFAALHTPFQRSAFDVQLRCHRLLVDRAAVGGWLGWTVVDLHDPAETTTILERDDRQETAIIRAWDVVTDVRTAIHGMWDRIEREQRDRGTDRRVSGAVVIVSNGGNRRRLTESAEAVVSGIAIFSNDWWASLGNVRVPMPSDLGAIWTDASLHRLRPRIPYVDGRARHPDPAWPP
jgi:transcriptional regulator with XRE-family HTH domain